MKGFTTDYLRQATISNILMKERFKQQVRMFTLAVWDVQGRMYLPIFDRNGDIEVYARALDAIIANFTEPFGEITCA